MLLHGWPQTWYEWRHVGHVMIAVPSLGRSLTCDKLYAL
jgi:hypothetical protein